jgi:probable HAF family extracellular repeat protein
VERWKGSVNVNESGRFEKCRNILEECLMYNNKCHIYSNNKRSRAARARGFIALCAALLACSVLGAAATVPSTPVHAQSFSGLGFLPGGSGSEALGVNADGTVVVGAGGAPATPSGVEAIRWTQAGGMVGLGFLSYGAHLSEAFGVNADGTVVVGVGNNVEAETFEEAFRWTQAGMFGLGFLRLGVGSEAFGVNADGTVVVGVSSGFVGPFGPFDIEAFRWTPAGMVGLGFLPGGSFSQAQAVNADGTVVAGTSGPEAFRWTQAGGMVGLGFLPGGSGSQALGVNADGTVVVGLGNATGTGGNSKAFRWTQAGGMQSVQALLTAMGVSTTGWTLTSAQGVSADGQVIVGSGTDPNGQEEGWIARLGTPFLAFSAQLQLDVNITPTKGAFALESSFTLSSTAPAINPLTQAVALQVGPFSATIPAGSFKQSGGLYTFAGVVNGVNLQALITPTGTLRYAFAAAAEHPNLTGTTNPVPVSLTVGNDSGTKSVKAIIFH